MLQVLRWLGNTSLASHVMRLLSPVALENQLPLTEPSIAMLEKVAAQSVYSLLTVCGADAV